LGFVDALLAVFNQFVDALRGSGSIEDADIFDAQLRQAESVRRGS
jgi:hypothetical protein